jgi:hypothetical protein
MTIGIAARNDHVEYWRGMEQKIASALKQLAESSEVADSSP